MLSKVAWYSMSGASTHQLACGGSCWQWAEQATPQSTNPDFAGLTPEPAGVPTVDDVTPAQRTAAAALAANNGLGAGAVLDLALAGVRSCHAPSDHPPALTLAA